MNEWSNMTFGEKIKYTRENMGISQNKLAKLSGMAQSSISYLESGDKKPNLDTITLIANALHIKVSDLLDNKEPDSTFPPNILDLVRIVTILPTEKVNLLIEVAKAMHN